MGNFKYYDRYNTGSNAAITMTKGNFSVNSVYEKSGSRYIGTLYRSNNTLYLKSSGLPAGVRAGSGSYLLFTEDL